MRIYREEILKATHQEMGKHLGIFFTQYQKIEKQYVTISKDNLYALKQTGCDLLWLLTGNVETHGICEKVLNTLETKRQKKKMLEQLILLAEEGARISQIDFSPTLWKAYKLLRFGDNNVGWGDVLLEEKIIWKKIREVEQLTQLQMAAILEIDVKRLRRLECGTTNVDAILLIKLYEKLDYSPMLFLNVERYCFDEINAMWDQFDNPVKDKLFMIAEEWRKVIKEGKEA